MNRSSLLVTLALSAMVLWAAAFHRLPPGLSGSQAVGILLGAWNTWFTTVRSLWNWPFGIAACLIFASVFGHAGLYGAMAMQVFYASVSVIGWRWWLQGKERNADVPVASAARETLAYGIGFTLIAAPALAIFLERIHDAASFPDAAAMALCLVAQYLVMRRLVENWYFWLAADTVYVGLYLTHHMPFMGLLYGIHAIMCLNGLGRWRRTLTPKAALSL